MKNNLIKIGITLATLIVLYVGWQMYSTYQEGERVREEAATLITQYEELQTSQEAYMEQLQPYETERVRCAGYVQQDSGDFSEFEYCQRYLEVGESR